MTYVKTVVYLRQSADRTGEELAISRQREDAYRLAQQRGWEVVGTHADNDTSAAGKAHRPGFAELIAALKAGRAQAVIAWDLTRLTRNARDTLRLLEAGEKHGITLALVRGSDMDLTTPAGRLTASVLASVARHEIEQKSDRQKRAALQAQEAGLPSGGRRPFGYEADRMTIRENEAAALRQAYGHILAGIPLARIADALNVAGLPTPQKTRAGGVSWWSAQTLRPALMNPRYAGLRARTIRPETGRPTWEIIGPAAWPAIVSEETWRAVGEKLSDPARSNPPGSARALLTGVAFCGVCGVDAAVTVHQGRNREHQRTYRCSVSVGHIARKADPVDDHIGDVVVGRLSRPDAIDLLDTAERPDTAVLRTEAMALRERLDGLAGLLADGVLTVVAVRRESGRLRNSLALVEAQLLDAGRVNVLGPLIRSDDVRAAWDALGTDRQRAVVDTLMVVVLHQVGRGTRTFRPETVQIVWKNA